MQTNRWLLPEGVQEVLPPESWRLEAARRELLDLYWRWGYDLIRPPLIEYLDSLLIGAEHDLDLLTFKLIDQLSGRTLGVRSDMTMQAARIDAHRLARNGPARYCYIGSILRTHPEQSGGSRSPLQIGAEMFGVADIQCDVEIISLMLETLALMGIAEVTLDLGHVAIYRSLVKHAGIEPQLEPLLFDIVQRKSLPDLEALCREQQLDKQRRRWFAAVIELNGPAHILEDAKARLAGIDPAIDAALGSLDSMLAQLQLHYPTLEVGLDLGELRGYRYKTGLLYTAFAPGAGRELARGGRYDDLGAEFGRGRPATGFSADLNLLANIGSYAQQSPEPAIYAPADSDPALLAAIRRLRDAGRRVIVATPDGRRTPQELGCGDVLEQHGGGWQLRSLTRHDSGDNK
ncbi:MAG TPA: ATP phosphoribosyltransferase regulatory subunit [Salinisphaeraceae bacterium]|nr:ATP phosphoribosyltransferase regulatory subunit [Salinisphaeraceae bacterium]